MSPATLAGAPAQNAPREKAPALLVPFVRAAQEHIESFHDSTTNLGASSVAISPIDVPAYGFMRGIFIEVEATGGGKAAGTDPDAVAKADAPFSALSDISMSDVNGSPIVGPLGGFDLFLVNKYGGYRRATTNPKTHPDYAGVSTTGNFKYLLYLPIEVSGRDGLGSLANLNAASSYKLRATVAPSSEVYSTAPTVLPKIRVRAWLDAWTQPAGADLRGNAQATQPPAHGTTSFWSKKIVNVSAGQQTIRLDRVGNMIRDLLFVYRDAAGVRNKGNFPGTLDLSWDTRLLKSLTPMVWRGSMSQRFGLTGADDSAAGLDTGVYVEDYCHEFDGLAGAELRDGWLPTVQSTRLEVLGNFGAAGTLTVLTNDVSPVGEVFV
jgi:hypothetical protein